MGHTDALAALENFTQYQRCKEENIAQRMDQVLDNRQRQLREVQEKQERRQRHAEQVRRRKALARDNGGVANESFDASEEYPTPRPDTESPRSGVTPTPEASSTTSTTTTSTMPSEEQPLGMRRPLQVQEARSAEDY